ncbi:MAG: hypothetical protein A3J48_00975 [Candidatus Doudnabacteria bacterium RIFCSPHIGHO2_02_FULL_46_11]|uniref:Bacterial type II secretion system protein E domain-containing protein n=1 Tax=Candidatus Doudnabacteria bacterium RIFCSPHIGHO2_02_FULL_46_11 TaxID=1817832 RepID=A0A1F5P7Z0_9BACT|nr:MAG: hypothetical protein A3J48_00975 [Candidatus Doudnabacteria bacterium RIFCSPHIGHO2_02_FULL_46_11]
MHISTAKLKEIIVSSGVIDEKNFESAKHEAEHLGQPLPNILIGRGSITEEYLLELLEQALGIPVVDLIQKIIPPEVLKLIPETYAKTNSVVAFEFDKKALKVAMVDPLNYEIIEYLRAKLGVWITPHFTTSGSLKYGLKQYHKQFAVEFHDIITENIKKFLTVGSEADLTKLAEAVPIITILESIIEKAISSNAADIHFEPFSKELLVRFRVDGILQEIVALPKAIEPILTARVKILSSMRIDEHSAPQDGRLKFEIDDHTSIDVRVSVMPVMHGERVAMRLLHSSARPLALEELGLTEKNIDILADEIKKPHGMILVTGPTGHGKTTTLYSIMYVLNTSEVNIMTIEDPIEYEIARVNQTQVNTKSGITFANGIRAHLRQNPDILMVGEIRDSETVEIAVHAALTGHLMLSTLHTNDAPSALPRLVDMGAPAFLLASTVNVVIAQRLVRKICSHCVESYQPGAEMKQSFLSHVRSADLSIKKIPTTLYRGKGCDICGHSGFQGQTGIYEILQVSDKIRELMLKEAPVGEINQLAINEGMVTMFQDGMDKVQKGITAIEEVVRVVRE